MSDSGEPTRRIVPARRAHDVLASVNVQYEDASRIAALLPRAEMAALGFVRKDSRFCCSHTIIDRTLDFTDALAKCAEALPLLCGSLAGVEGSQIEVRISILSWSGSAAIGVTEEIAGELSRWGAFLAVDFYSAEGDGSLEYVNPSD